MHDEVKVVCHDGREATGFSLGAGWWGPASDPRVMLEVESADATGLVVGIDEVESLTPKGGHEDVEEFVAMVANAVRTASMRGQVDGDPMVLIVGSHSTLEVTLRVDDHPCCPETVEPPPPTYW